MWQTPHAWTRDDGLARAGVGHDDRLDRDRPVHPVATTPRTRFAHRSPPTRRLWRQTGVMAPLGNAMRDGRAASGARAGSHAMSIRGTEAVHGPASKADLVTLAHNDASASQTPNAALTNGAIADNDIRLRVAMSADDDTTTSCLAMAGCDDSRAPIPPSPTTATSPHVRARRSFDLSSRSPARQRAVLGRCETSLLARSFFNRRYTVNGTCTARPRRLVRLTGSLTRDRDFAEKTPVAGADHRVDRCQRCPRDRSCRRLRHE